MSGGTPERSRGFHRAFHCVKLTAGLRLLGAVIVTPPACYYLWPDQSHAEHHGGEHEEHGEAHEEEKEGEEEAPAEESKPEPEQQEEEKEGEQEQPKEEKKDDAPAQDTTAEQEEAKESEETAKPSGSEGESQPQSNDANKISSKTEEGTSEPKTKAGSTTTGKGHMKEGAPGHDDTRKREPDSKGAYKKRVDSGLQKDLGASDNPVSSDDENTSGPAGVSARSSVFLPFFPSSNYTSPSARCVISSSPTM